MTYNAEEGWFNGFEHESDVRGSPQIATMMLDYGYRMLTYPRYT